MIFSIVVIVLVGVIAFFHYLQGFFSATLSAVSAIVAAVLAVSFHEPLLAALLQGRFADQAHAFALVVLFAGIYLGLRVMFDKLIPGNVRVPSLADKIGGGAMGVVAGIFATGVLAIAAQSLPLRPSIAGYARYDVVSQRDVIIPGRWQQQNAYVFEELRGDSLDRAQEQTLLLPVDDVVVSTVAHLSDGGSLGGRQPLAQVHPDYLEQMFANRVGIQVGGKRTLLPQQVSLVGLHRIGPIRQQEGEIPQIRERNLPDTYQPQQDHMLLVVRVLFDVNAADDRDRVFRFSPGSVRLVAGEQNYYPIGTLERGSTLYNHKPDDFLFIDLRNEDRGADLVFEVPEAQLLGAAANGDQVQVPQGVFVEIKRMARLDLSGQPIQGGISASPQIQVMRRPVEQRN